MDVGDNLDPTASAAAPNECPASLGHDAGDGLCALTQMNAAAVRGVSTRRRLEHQTDRLASRGRKSGDRSTPSGDNGATVPVQRKGDRRPRRGARAARVPPWASASTGKLCARCEEAIGLMILTPGSEGQRLVQEAEVQPPRLITWQTLSGAATPKDGASLVAAARSAAADSHGAETSGL